MPISKRNLVEQASPSLGLFSKAPISAAAFWTKVGARFYLGRELPEEKIFAITWGRRDGCGDLLDMFVRCADEPHGDDVAVGVGNVDVEIPF